MGAGTLGQALAWIEYGHSAAGAATAGSEQELEAKALQGPTRTRRVRSKLGNGTIDDVHRALVWIGSAAAESNGDASDFVLDPGLAGKLDGARDS